MNRTYLNTTYKVEDEKYIKILRLIESGHTLENIGKLYGVSRQRIHQIVGSGVSKNLFGRRNRFKKKYGKRIKSLYENCGKTMEEISTLLDLTIHQIKYFCWTEKLVHNKDKKEKIFKNELQDKLFCRNCKKFLSKTKFTIKLQAEYHRHWRICASCNKKNQHFYYSIKRTNKLC